MQALWATPPAKRKGRVTDPAEHGQGALDNGQVQAHGDVGGLLAPGHQGGGLAFGEDGAHAVDLDAFVGLEGKIAEFLQRHCRAVAMNSRNLPVPAAQRSFISNLATLPVGVRAMTLVSWPPMSRTVRASG